MPDPAFANRYSLLRRAVVVWFILIAVEFVHGVLRFIFLVPYVGDFRARQIGVFTGSVLIVAVAYLFIGWLQPAVTKSLMMVGMLWLVLTVAFEFSFGHFVFRRSWNDLASDYDLLHGGLLPIGMVVLAFSPVIAARLRNLVLPVL
jgi:hypothetical protein